MAFAMIHKVRQASLVAAISLALTLPAYAQSTEEGAAEKKQDVTQLEQVTVTAQKREQDMQDVPIAITALDRSQIEAMNIESARDLDGIVPGLQMSPDISFGQGAQIFIRGMGQPNLSISRNSRVGVYLDGVYIGGNNGNVLDLVDMNRVEVLRGPQGTLYGRNSLAGAINMISNEPSGILAGYASIEASNYNGFLQKVHTDLPEIGIASISVSARSNQRDGWVNAAVRDNNHDIFDVNERGVRIATLFRFSPDFKAEYTYDRNTSKNNGNFMQLVSANDAFFNQFGFTNVSQYGSKDRLTKHHISGNQFFLQHTGGQSLTLNWDVNPQNTLKSITAYRAFERWAAPDQDGTPYNIVLSEDPPPGLTMNLPGYDPQDPLYEYKQYSQELQWVGSFNNFNYVGGLYYYGSDGSSGGMSSYFGLTHTASFYRGKDKSVAVYGQLDWQPIEPLTMTVGMRQNWDKTRLVNKVFGCRLARNCMAAPGEAFKWIIPPGTGGSATFKAFTPAYSINWKFNEQLSVYGRFAEGFQAGGFNTGVGTASKSTEQNIKELLTTYRPEKSKSLELGAKATLFDGRLQGALSVFNTDYTDLQQSVYVAQDAGATTLTRNASEATMKGVELEGAFMVRPGTIVRAHYAYLDASYGKFIEDSKQTGLPTDYSKNRAFSHAPRNSYGLSVDTRLAQFAWGTLRAHLDFSHTDTMYTSSNQLLDSGPQYDPGSAVAGRSMIPAYQSLNMQLKLTEMPLSENATGELGLWCRNCTNESTPNNVLDFGPGFGNLLMASFTTPVTYGILATVRW